jgi:hypothetical protein
MHNRAMLRKLTAGDCVDVSDCARTPEGFYILTEFKEGLDYADGAAERWIWSIGKRNTDGVILASQGVDFYQNPDFECLFLR